MKFKSLAVSAALAAALCTGAANATTYTTLTHNYGNGVGEVDPGGADVLSAGYVTVSDDTVPRFNDSFDLSGIAYTIDSFDLTLEFEAAGPNGFLGLGETWSVRMQGSNPGSIFDDAFGVMFDVLSPQTFSINAGSAGDVFEHSVASDEFEFWFSETTFRRDNFNLRSASLTVATVPLPASGMLLLGALGGAAALRRRKKNAKKA